MIRKYPELSMIKYKNEKCQTEDMKHEEFFKSLIIYNRSSRDDRMRWSNNLSRNG